MENNQSVSSPTPAGNPSSKSAEVKAFFDQTQLYLKDDFVITTRAAIIGGLLGTVSKAKILDIGCGDGGISRQFLTNGNHITLVDFSDQMLKVAKSRAPQEFDATADYINMNFMEFDESEQYDIVLCIGVLAHVDSVEEAIAKVGKLLKPGGRCVFQITDTDQFMGRLQHRLNAVRRAIKRQKKHEQNKLGFNTVRTIAARNDIQFVDRKRYMIRLPIPGMGRLPSEWLMKFDLFTMRTPALGRHGAETVALFRKK